MGFMGVGGSAMGAGNTAVKYTVHEAGWHCHYDYDCETRQYLDACE